MEAFIPGTTLPYPEDAASAFSSIRPLITATGGLSLSQVGAITGLEGSTIQNWVKRRWVPKPVEKKYGCAHLPRILLISALRDHLQIEQIIQLITYVTMPADSGAASLSESDLFDCLCAVVHQLPTLDAGMLHTRARRLAQSYGGGNRDLAQRLEEALSVMALLYIAGTIRRQALALLRQFL